jgi:hypothetical protein
MNDSSARSGDLVTRYGPGNGAGGAGGGIAPPGPGGLSRPGQSRSGGDSLVDLLDRVLDKGVVIAGDIKINLLDIELLTIKIRLLIASADKAKEMGIDWWTHDPELSSKAKDQRHKLDADQENKELRERVAQLESRLNALLDQSEGPQRDRSRAALPGRRARD